jgi:hypothetical protein
LDKNPTGSSVRGVKEDVVKAHELVTHTLCHFFVACGISNLHQKPTYWKGRGSPERATTDPNIPDERWHHQRRRDEEFASE